MKGGTINNPVRTISINKTILGTPRYVSILSSTNDIQTYGRLVWKWCLFLLELRTMAFRRGKERDMYVLIL